MTVRIGLIGAGGMGRAHAERITTELSGGRIVAVADINLDNAKVVAEPLGAKAYSSGGGASSLLILALTPYSLLLSVRSMPRRGHRHSRW